MQFLHRAGRHAEIGRRTADEIGKCRRRLLANLAARGTGKGIAKPPRSQICIARRQFEALGSCSCCASRGSGYFGSFAYT